MKLQSYLLKQQHNAGDPGKEAKTMTRRFQDPELEVVHLLLQQMILKTRVERLQQRLATATELLTVADQGCDAEEQGDECPICEFLGYGTQSTTCSTNTNPEGTS